MPIIEPIADPGAPLSQGDILKGVTLISTLKTWEAEGGEAKLHKNALCMVLSRPCNALRDEWVNVARIDAYKNKPPSSFESLEEARLAFEEIRDGLKTPDFLYLGQIEGFTGSFGVRFDSLHTIQLPPENSTKRTGFLALARIARLNRDFCHDLHLRLTRAFASLGFDDHRWFPTEDLRSFVMFANRDMLAMRKELSEVQATLQIGVSQSSVHPSTKQQLEKKQAELETKLTKLTTELAPYKDELSIRDQQKNPANP